MARTFPSLATLESDDDGRLAAELQLSRLRAQVAVVRALADHIDIFAEPGDAHGLGPQFAEEVARLVCRLSEAAMSMARPAPVVGGVDR